VNRLLELLAGNYGYRVFFIVFVPQITLMNVLKEPSDIGKVMAKMIFHAKLGEVVIRKYFLSWFSPG